MCKSSCVSRCSWNVLSEDGEFTMRLMLDTIPVKLVDVPGGANGQGLAAHTYHADTASGGEFYYNVRLGDAVGGVPG